MSGLAKATIYKLVHQGRLRGFRVLNRTLRFDPVDIMALVRELPVDSSAISGNPRLISAVRKAFSK